MQNAKSFPLINVRTIYRIAVIASVVFGILAGMFSMSGGTEITA